MKFAKAVPLLIAALPSVAGFSIQRPCISSSPATIGDRLPVSSCPGRLAPLKMSETVEKKEEETFE